MLYSGLGVCGTGLAASGAGCVVRPSDPLRSGGRRSLQNLYLTPVVGGGRVPIVPTTEVTEMATSMPPRIDYSKYSDNTLRAIVRDLEYRIECADYTREDRQRWGAHNCGEIYRRDLADAQAQLRERVVA